MEGIKSEEGRAALTVSAYWNDQSGQFARIVRVLDAPPAARRSGLGSSGMVGIDWVIAADLRPSGEFLTDECFQSTSWETAVLLGDARALGDPVVDVGSGASTRGQLRALFRR